MWEMLERVSARQLRLREFYVRKIGKYFVLPKMYQDEKCNIYVDYERRVVWIKFSENGMYSVGKILSLSSNVKKRIFGDEKLCVVYGKEKDLFLSPYSLGSEHLRNVLVKEKII